MNNRKNQNPILVLATLGVYLGLVLAGATPQVLAQAAMAREFNAKDEIEVKDDLDKSPDGEEIKAFLENRFETALSSFVRDLRDLNALGKYRKSGDDTFSISASYRQCLKDGASGDSSFGPASVDSDWIAKAFASLQKNLAPPDEFPTFMQFAVAERGDRCKTFESATELDTSDHVIRLSFTRDGAKNAVQIKNGLVSFFAERASGHVDPLTRQIYQFTKASSKNDQVFIITRLPRAGLDALVSTDAK